jgi:hypothetical protein
MVTDSEGRTRITETESEPVPHRTDLGDSGEAGKDEGWVGEGPPDVDSASSPPADAADGDYRPSEMTAPAYDPNDPKLQNLQERQSWLEEQRQEAAARFGEDDSMVRQIDDRLDQNREEISERIREMTPESGSEEPVSGTLDSEQDVLPPSDSGASRHTEGDRSLESVSRENQQTRIPINTSGRPTGKPLRGGWEDRGVTSNVAGQGGPSVTLPKGFDVETHGPEDIQVDLPPDTVHAGQRIKDMPMENRRRIVRRIQQTIYNRIRNGELDPDETP